MTKSNQGSNMSTATATTVTDVPDIETPEGIEELRQKLEGIDLELSAIKETFHNAPTSMVDAVKRIMELEMRLEDLSRSVEIAEITGQLNMVEGFRRSADECLENKITYKREANGDIKLNVITGQLDPSKLPQPI